MRMMNMTMVAAYCELHNILWHLANSSSQYFWSYFAKMIAAYSNREPISATLLALSSFIILNISL